MTDATLLKSMEARLREGIYIYTYENDAHQHVKSNPSLCMTKFFAADNSTFDAAAYAHLLSSNKIHAIAMLRAVLLHRALTLIYSVRKETPALSELIVHYNRILRKLQGEIEGCINNMLLDPHEISIDKSC